MASERVENNVGINLFLARRVSSSLAMQRIKPRKESVGLSEQRREAKNILSSAIIYGLGKH